MYKVNLSDLMTEEVSLRKTRDPATFLRRRMDKREYSYPSKDGEMVTMTVYFDKKLVNIDAKPVQPLLTMIYVYGGFGNVLETFL